MMLVKNKLLAALITVPLYVACALVISKLVDSPLAYIAAGVLVLYLCEVAYYYAVIARAYSGSPQVLVAFQWILGQVFIVGSTYTALLLWHGNA